MSRIPRHASIATPISLLLTLAVATAATAQVASLGAPEETPGPDEAALVVEFADRDDALLAFAQCMRDNGIDMDDPGLDGSGRGFFGRGPGGAAAGLDQFGEDFRLAQEACGDILEAARPDIDPALQQERLEDELRMAQCFRDNGYPEYPDPSLGGDGRLQRGGLPFGDLGIDPRSEEFQETRTACAEQLGLEDAFGPGGRPGFGAGGGS